MNGRPTLAGIRSATTQPQLDLIDHATEVLAAIPGVLGAWLVGSFATGEADPWSDVDLHCLVTDELADAVTDGRTDLVGAITPTVQARPIPGWLGWACLTPEWVHIDVLVHRAGSIDPMEVKGMRPLLDKQGLLPRHVVPRAPFRGDPYFPADVVDWFFYMLGNLVTVVGRGEWTLASNGVVTIRDTALVPLLLAESGITRVGGNKRLYPLLTREQRDVLERMGPLDTTLDSVVAAELYLARHFTARGRRLASVTGSRWPEALESATRRHVEHGLGMTFDYTSGQ